MDRIEKRVSPLFNFIYSYYSLIKNDDPFVARKCIWIVFNKVRNYEINKGGIKIKKKFEQTYLS